jgi:hypothetical protein
MTRLWPPRVGPIASCRTRQLDDREPPITALYVGHSASSVALIRLWTTLPKEAGACAQVSMTTALSPVTATIAPPAGGHRIPGGGPVVSPFPPVTVSTGMEPI